MLDTNMLPKVITGTSAGALGAATSTSAHPQRN